MKVFRSKRRVASDSQGTKRFDQSIALQCEELQMKVFLI